MTIEKFYETIQARAFEVGALCQHVRDDDPDFWLNYGMATAFSKAEYHSAQELKAALANARDRWRERKKWGDWRKARYYAGVVKGLVEVGRIRSNVEGLDGHIKAMFDAAHGLTPHQALKSGLPEHSVG